MHENLHQNQRSWARLKRKSRKYKYGGRGSDRISEGEGNKVVKKGNQKWMRWEERLALGDIKWVWEVREGERKDRQKDWNRKREGVAEKRERWKGCSPDNPSSLHMIISEAANEPLLHIWNTNNLTLNQKWQARLVIGRGLLLLNIGKD